MNGKIQGLIIIIVILVFFWIIIDFDTKISDLKSENEDLKSRIYCVSDGGNYSDKEIEYLIRFAKCTQDEYGIQNIEKLDELFGN